MAMLCKPVMHCKHTKLCIYVLDSFFRCFHLELTHNYDHNSFLDDLRRLYFNAGVKSEDTTFLFTDTQIVQEDFLEDISNILNSGKYQ
jgi:dynein heavy chain